jgi:hypothetical protein
LGHVTTSAFSSEYLDGANADPRQSAGPVQTASKPEVISLKLDGAFGDLVET